MDQSVGSMPIAVISGPVTALGECLGAAQDGKTVRVGGLEGNEQAHGSIARFDRGRPG